MSRSDTTETFSATGYVLLIGSIQDSQLYVDCFVNVCCFHRFKSMSSLISYCCPFLYLFLFLVTCNSFWVSQLVLPNLLQTGIVVVETVALVLVIPLYLFIVFCIICPLVFLITEVQQKRIRRFGWFPILPLILMAIVHFQCSLHKTHVQRWITQII